MELMPVEIFRGVVLVCFKLYIPGGRMFDCTRPLGGVSGFSVYKSRIIIVRVLIAREKYLFVVYVWNFC
jgi:hypothetical protein